MEKDYLFFISHRSEDREYALELESILLEANPEWKGKIFLDCGEAKPLEVTPEWEQAMMEAASNSRHLIFIARKVDHLKKGNGWLRKEVAEFHKLHENHMDKGRPDKNISYFGIFLCDCNLEKDLFADPEYGRLYSSMLSEQEHLLLGGDTTLAKEKVRIQEKAKAMVERRPYDDFACIMRERVREFRDNQIKNGAMWADSLQQGETADPDVNYIDDQLLPPLQLSNNADKSEKEDKNNTVSFDGLCKLVRQQHVQVIGKEGGSGKTTLLTKLFHHYLKLCEEDLENGMIPLYVDAKALAANNSLILRHLARVLLKDVRDIKSESTGERVNKLRSAFAEVRQTPRYLLLIDGYNELPKGKESELTKELREFMTDGPLRNVRLVISGRSIEGELPEEEFTRVTVRQLDRKVVGAYVKKWMNQSAFEILRTPMYLKMFQDTGSYTDIQTKADLLKRYIARQEKKDRESAADGQTKAIYYMLLRHVMGAVAYGMMVDTGGTSEFVLTPQQQKAWISVAHTQIKQDDYQEYYDELDETFYKSLEDSKICDMGQLGLRKEFEKYFLSTCKLLHKNSDGNFEFVHQIYRDFFCAWYLAEAIRYDLHQETCSETLMKKVFRDDVVEFAKDLLGEEQVVYSEEKDAWDYSCNERSALLKMLALIRGKHLEGEAMAVANIVEMLRVARWKDLSGLDLSKLDLTASNLQGCIFSRYDKHSAATTPNGFYATDFHGAIINKENLFTERHYYNLRAVCTNQKHLVCLDEGGYLKFWKKMVFPRFPEKVLTDLHCAAKKLLFSTDGTKLYAMTLHEILEIPIPEEFTSRAMPKRIFRTAHQLRDIVLDGQGQLRFCTYLNPFNYKKITEPDAPDEIPVYDLNSAAAINADGTCLAYGFIAGHNELKIYDRQEDGTWKERIFGFGKLMREFFGELEDLFRSFGVHEVFYPDGEDTPEKKMYFDRFLRDEMNQFGNLEGVPTYVVDACVRDLGTLQTTLEDDQKDQLNALAQKYTQRIKTALDEQGTLMRLNGRQITGLSFHSDNKTLLLSGTIDYRKSRSKKKINLKLACSNWVVTVNTETMEAKKINMHRGKNANRAFYCGDDIVVMTRYQANVYDAMGNEVAVVRPEIHRLKKMLYNPERKNFFVLSNHNIYEMDYSLRCIRCIRNGLDGMQLHYFRDRNGEKYIWTDEKRTLQNSDCNCIDLHNGNTRPAGRWLKKKHSARNNLDIGPRHFEFRSNMLVAFYNNVRYAQTTLYQGLYVCGCDFRGVDGSVKETEYIQSLYRMGAETDPVELPVVAPVTDQEPFTPSRKPLSLPFKYRKIPFVYRNDQKLEDCSYGKNESTNSILADKRTWELLHNNAATGTLLDAADLSTLEWVDQLRLGTWNVINELGEAGLIPPSMRDHDLGSRILKFMAESCKFYHLVGHYNRDGELSPALASLQYPFGVKLLAHITGNKLVDYWYELLHKRESRPVTDEEQAELEFEEEIEEPAEESEQAEQTEAEQTEAEQNEAESEEKTQAYVKPEKNIHIDKPETLKKVRVILGLNRWFSLTAKEYKDKIEDYALNKIFETDCHYDGRGKVNGYLLLGNQAFFGQSIHEFDRIDQKKDEEVIHKVKRLSTMALYYRSLVSEGMQLDGMTRQPILVLIGDNFAQCERLHVRVQKILPLVRKIYTFDELLIAEDATAGKYFEFADGHAYSLKLDDLIQ